MKKPVILSIQGCQYYSEQEPEVIELVTEGTMEYRDGGWDICYEESDLTGLAGVTTTFRLESGQVLLQRTGKLRSEMLFREGFSHDSLYQRELGALMLRSVPSRSRRIFRSGAAWWIWCTASRSKAWKPAWWSIIWISAPKRKNKLTSCGVSFFNVAFCMCAAGGRGYEVFSKFFLRIFTFRSWIFRGIVV
jgi:uncharacterized beta-barrel protein YwiB (DUF1934 family)